MKYLKHVFHTLGCGLSLTDSFEREKMDGNSLSEHLGQEFAKHVHVRVKTVFQALAAVEQMLGNPKLYNTHAHTHTASGSITHRQAGV